MSEIHDGELDDFLDKNAHPEVAAVFGIQGRETGCLSCRMRVEQGAYWAGAVDLKVCRDCLLEGKLGLLIADGVAGDDLVGAAARRWTRSGVALF